MLFNSQNLRLLSENDGYLIMLNATSKSSRSLPFKTIGSADKIANTLSAGLIESLIGLTFSPK